MSFDCPLRGPATGARLEQQGLPEIYKNGRGEKRDRTRMRKACKEHAKANGDHISAMTKTQYKIAVTRQFWKGERAKRDASWKQYQESKLHSLNPQKAARVQAIRDAWAKVKAKESKNT